MVAMLGSWYSGYDKDTDAELVEDGFNVWLAFSADYGSEDRNCELPGDPEKVRVYDCLAGCFKAGRLSEFEYFDLSGEDADYVNSAFGKSKGHDADVVREVRSGVAAFAYGNVVHKGQVGRLIEGEAIVP